MRRFLLFVTSAWLVFICSATDFISVNGPHFYRGTNGQPYYFVGANFLYAALLASEHSLEGRSKLLAELNALKALGVDNLRISVFPKPADCKADTDSVWCRMDKRNSLENFLDGLDFLLAELVKRDMTATLCLVNPEELNPALIDGWCSEFSIGQEDWEKSTVKQAERFPKHFMQCEDCQNKYFKYIEVIVSHTNRYTGTSYEDSPAVMSWQVSAGLNFFEVGKEPSYWRWMERLIALVKRIDSNHLLSVESGRIRTDEKYASVYERIGNKLNVDYFSFNLWPLEWRWASRGALRTSLPNVYLNAQAYIDFHERMARKYDKPLVLNAFGFPRDRSFLFPHTPVSSRDGFYAFVFSNVRKSVEEQGVFSGCYFWGWAGSGRPEKSGRFVGEKYPGDYRNDLQGLYSVYDVDSTTLTCIYRNTRLGTSFNGFCGE